MLRALFLKKETASMFLSKSSIYAFELGFEILQWLSICARSFPLSTRAGLHPPSITTYFFILSKVDIFYNKNVEKYYKEKEKKEKIIEEEIEIVEEVAPPIIPQLQPMRKRHLLPNI